MTHGGLAGLGAAGRLAYTVGTTSGLLARAVDNALWVGLHAACALALALTLARYPARLVPALAASTGVMGTWAGLTFLWALTSTRPVSMAGPALGLGMAAVAYVLTLSWAVVDRGGG